MARPKASRPHMPGYGILESRRGVLPWSWAAERLQVSRTYWIATSRPDARPHVMPVWGIWLKNAFFFSTGQQSRKALNLKANPYCSVAAEIGIGKRLKKNEINDSVVLEGKAELVAESRLRKSFCELYEKKYAWDMKGFEEPIYRVVPATVFGFTEGFSQNATKWTF